ncbi:MAG: hypothetical protein J6B99_04050 [Oscillospiraceae bacterium]|nr:hypothetical protein [Oscillospiraceae bacterium]
MRSGLSFADVLVSPVTMAVAVILFFLCAWLLLFKRKAITTPIKVLSALVLIVTILYIAFIIWMIVGFGQH